MGIWRKKADPTPYPRDAADANEPVNDNSQTSYQTSSYLNDRQGLPRRTYSNESARNELLGLAPPGTYERSDSYGSHYQKTNRYVQEEDDAQVAAYKQEIYDVKQASLASIKRAVESASQAEQSATASMNMLSDQSSKIANVDQNVELAAMYTDQAAAQASTLKKLNKSIFIPVVNNPFKSAKREEEKIEAARRAHAQLIREEERARQEANDTRQRMEDANQRNQLYSANRATRRSPTVAGASKYQFEPDEEDDALEAQIDEGLDFLDDATVRLKNMAITMNSELENQNERIDRIIRNVEPVPGRLQDTTRVINKIK